MRTHLSHVQINVAAANLPWYRELMSFLGWPVLHEDGTVLGVGGTGKDSLWFSTESNGATGDYDATGMNHIGLGTDTQADVDAACEFLRSKGIELLFETPRHRPEFASSPEETYYQVMFESPDRVLFEVVYTGTKS